MKLLEYFITFFFEFLLETNSETEEIHTKSLNVIYVYALYSNIWDYFYQ